MPYNISRDLVREASDTLDTISQNVRRGEPTFFDVPPRETHTNMVYRLHELLASAKVYDDMGYGHLRDICSVTVDYDSGQVVVYPASEGRWNKPGAKTKARASKVSGGGSLRSAHDVYAEFRNSDTTETRLRFRLPDDWDSEIEGMGGKTGEDLFRLACDSDGIRIGELTYHEEDDGTRWASCYAVKESATRRRQRSGRGGFDSLGQHYDKD